MDSVRLNIDGTIETISKGDQAGVLSCLARQVELAPGYTLRSFFKMLENHDALVHLSAFFPDLLDQFADPDCEFISPVTVVFRTENTEQMLEGSINTEHRPPEYRRPVDLLNTPSMFLLVFSGGKLTLVNHRAISHVCLH